MPFADHPVHPVPSKGAPPAAYPLAGEPQGFCVASGFDRPSYFAGHLLTDADLTLGQCYLREKNKLHNRALHGDGVVCGLRLSCDHDHPRAVFVSPGHAVDAWGNDLVVPESSPFDVIGALIAKGLLFPGSPPDPPGPEHARAVHPLRKRFHITASYHEEQADFAAPLVSAGPAALGECEPTRIREMVRIDVSDAPPERQDATDALQRRLEMCFSIFSDGAFAQALRNHRRALTDLAASGANPEANYQKIFYELQGHLLLYLRKHPDKYDAVINDEIRQVRFPDLREAGDQLSPTYVETLRGAFSSLLALAWQHAVHGALGELVPRCPEPGEVSRVLLGTVVVENGRVVQVCNCPRPYVWSPANFPSVMLAMAFGGLACQQEDEEAGVHGDQAGTETLGCRRFDFDLACFLRWLSVSPKAASYAGTELLRWIDEVKRSVQEGFDFTNPCKFSAKMFEQLHESHAESHLRDAGVPYRIKESPLARETPPLFTVLQTAGLASGNQQIVLEVKEGTVSGARARQSDLIARIQHLQRQVDSLKAQVEQRNQSQR